MMKYTALISDFQDKNDCWGLCVIKFENNKFFIKNDILEL